MDDRLAAVYQKKLSLVTIPELCRNGTTKHYILLAGEIKAIDAAVHG
jgi:hypothetical protein